MDKIKKTEMQRPEYVNVLGCAASLDLAGATISLCLGLTVAPACGLVSIAL